MCDTEVVVVRGTDVELDCGGVAMVESGGDRPGGTAPEAGRADGTLLGKRYQHAESGLQVLCVKAGAGSLSVAGTALSVLESKQLPSSD